MSARVDLDKTTMVGEVNLAIAKGSVDESAPDATEARAEVSAATERLAELETSAAEHAAKAAEFQLNAGKLHSKRLALVETRDMLDESVKLEEGFAATKHATISKYVRAKRAQRRADSAAEAGRRGGWRGHERNERNQGVSLYGGSGLLSERRKQARATKECPSAAEAGCFARGLSEGDPPTPPCG
jgi:hypothetical protein